MVLIFFYNKNNITQFVVSITFNQITNYDQIQFWIEVEKCINLFYLND